MHRHRMWVLIVGAILLAAWARPALAGGGGGGPCSGFASGETLVMRDSCFDGVAHFVDAGTTLVVRNDGQMPHSYTAVDGSFDTGVILAGKSAEITLKTTGIVQVYCTIHGTASGHGMSGILFIAEVAPGTEAVSGQAQAADAAAGQAQTLEAALNQHDSALLGELQAQSKTLAELKTDVADLKQSVAANASANIQPNLAALLGILGIMLGGGALAVVVGGRWRASRSGKT